MLTGGAHHVLAILLECLHQLWRPAKRDFARIGKGGQHFGGQLADLQIHGHR